MSEFSHLKNKLLAELRSTIKKQPLRVRPERLLFVSA